MVNEISGSTGALQFNPTLFINDLVTMIDKKKLRISGVVSTVAFAFGVCKTGCQRRKIRRTFQTEIEKELWEKAAIREVGSWFE